MIARVPIVADFFTAKTGICWRIKNRAGFYVAKIVIAICYQPALAE
jgi:hypothetical protein